LGQEFYATRNQARELDKAAIDAVGVKGLILMENAGRACAAEAVHMLRGAGAADDEGPPLARGAAGKRVVVFCGMGNNGGDGFVVARHLHNWGAQVGTVLLGGISDALRKAGDAAVNLEIALNMDIPVVEVADAAQARAAAQEAGAADLLVDALLGTGLDRDVGEPYRALIEGINKLGSPVLAVDVPSGLDCDTGRALGCAVRAAVTVTFVLPKRGFACPGAAEYTGEIKVAEISVPRGLIADRVARWKSQEGS
jgi:NAD(P)H-hydrate epimerase